MKTENWKIFRLQNWTICCAIFFIKTRKVIVDKDNDDEYEPSVL